MAKAKKKAAKGAAKADKKKVIKNFPAFWAEIGVRLAKEVKAEKGWDQKTFFAKLNADSGLQVKIVECTKGLLPRETVSASTCEKPMGSGLYGSPSSAAKAIGAGSDDFWSSCESSSNKSGSTNNPRS